MNGVHTKQLSSGDADGRRQKVEQRMPEAGLFQRCADEQRSATKSEPNPGAKLPAIIETHGTGDLGCFRSRGRVSSKGALEDSGAGLDLGHRRSGSRRKELIYSGHIKWPMIRLVNFPGAVVEEEGEWPRFCGWPDKEATGRMAKAVSTTVKIHTCRMVHMWAGTK